MTELTWRAAFNLAGPALELTAKDGGKTQNIGWLLLDGEESSMFEYVHSTHEIEHVLSIHVDTLEEAKRVVETAVRLKCDLRVVQP